MATPLQMAERALGQRKQAYSCEDECRAFIMAWVYGWNERKDKAPNFVRTDWPNAYGAGYWEGYNTRQVRKKEY